jgi:hypothetical protein
MNNKYIIKVNFYQMILEDFDNFLLLQVFNG